MIKPKPGDVYGRWKVLRDSSPRAKRHGERPRKCVWVECACGVKQSVFVEDLRQDDAPRVGDRSGTSGCRSGRCRTAWRGSKRCLQKLEELERLGMETPELVAEFRLWAVDFVRRERAKDFKYEMGAVE